MKAHSEEDRLADAGRQTRYEQMLLPHLDAAYNLARWLTHDEHDAEDLVQEAYLRALKFFSSFHGDNGKVWLLTIVRNTCYSWLRRNRPDKLAESFDETVHSAADDLANPQRVLLQEEENQLFRDALQELPMEYREVLVLRELEGLTYREIAAVSGIALGTVMSRLARGRERLRQCLPQQVEKET
ncbi:MAG: sigma-70 family RNA polymerase sigma factor [Planctomycetota bacterium]|nr:MAG: sigma-70 family RNA polymerase sigma factor [Planctomycetota bacterium]